MKTVVVLGASQDRAKYGNKATRAYLRQGFNVIPVNPKAEEIEGLQAVAGLEEIRTPVDRVALYVPPHVGLALIESIAALKPSKVFVNPGAESPELLAAAERLGLNVILGCAILDIGETPADHP